jgi:hypothetical protein
VVGRYARDDLTIQEPHVFYPLPPEISEHWFRIGRSVRLDAVLLPETRVVHWYASALIADRFLSGRVFLAGDAAHTLPPARGGYGANTGIEDSFNLAWRLASVVTGVSTPELLDSYDAERRPIAWLRHNQIFARQDYAPIATGDEKKVSIIEDAAMELGQIYRSAAVLGAGDELPPALRPEPVGVLVDALSHVSSAPRRSSGAT